MADFLAAAGEASVPVNSTTTCTSSRWLTEEVFRLIDMVQSDEAIYNPRHKYYFCRPYVENFWREVDLRLEKNPGASLAKWTNLRISFRREYTNYLEEKVPPCWSYFDRMFFLHPYLRKKHTPSKSLDNHMQDALAHINSISHRLQHERSIPSGEGGGNGVGTSGSLALENMRQAAESIRNGAQQQPLDNYLEYFDGDEQNNSELEDNTNEEQQACFHNPTRRSPNNNDIKSECEDQVDDDEPEQRQEDDVEEEEDSADRTFRNLVMNSLTQEKRAHVYVPGYSSYKRRAKRPRSQDNTSSSPSSTNNSHVLQRTVCSSTPTHTNISFVRPTFAKPIELVTTTSSANHSVLDGGNDGENLATAAGNSVRPISLAHPQQRHPHLALHHRVESNINPPGAVAPVASTGNAHQDLCDCKTDPDAMFLMSLLPDIQRLNGRDRGKIKIAFQNILQDFLYPD